jgi:hypothetical protein
LYFDFESTAELPNCRFGLVMCMPYERERQCLQTRRLGFDPLADAANKDLALFLNPSLFPRMIEVFETIVKVCSFDISTLAITRGATTPFLFHCGSEASNIMVDPPGRALDTIFFR